MVHHISILTHIKNATMKTTAKISENMTKFITAITLSLLAIIVLSSCAGEEYYPRTVTKDGIIYQLDYEKREAMAIGYNSVGGEPSLNSIYIPSEVKTGVRGETMRVTAVADRAFYDAPCKLLFIGDNVKYIGSQAFAACNLEIIGLEGTVALPIASSDAFNGWTTEHCGLNVRPEFYNEALVAPTWCSFRNIFKMNIISFE